MTDSRRAGLALLVLFALASGPQRLWAADGPESYLKKSDDWFGSDEARRIAAKILSYQSDLGAWPANVDTTAAPFQGDRKDLKGTFDNGATTGELRFLARAFRATKSDEYRRAFERGLDAILKAQYPTGGWPQFDPPPGRAYHRYITFNDNAMVRLMELLRNVHRSDGFAFVDQERRTAAGVAFDLGVACILRCQVRVDGKLTAWCAQHDEENFLPRPGRTFELASLSGGESVGIVRLLMAMDQPNPAIVKSVEAAVAWLQAVKVTGIREVIQKDARSPTGMNKVIVDDPAAPPLWARFYEIGTNRPLFADRDGVPRYKLADLGYERRNGYAWYGSWPQPLLKREYPAWRKKWVVLSESPGPSAPPEKRVRIVLVGDSTVAQGSGWGPGFIARLGKGAECVNMARGGRSSKSYRDEGTWDKVLQEKPDYVLIQFGHNDQPGKGPERETDPATTFRENLARFVGEARAAGAKPILLTPMTRRTFTGDGKIRPDGLELYAAAARAVAAEKQVPLIDLHARSIAYLERIGPAASAELDMASKDPAKPDRTHLSAKGSDVMAELVIEDLKVVVPALEKALP